MIEISHQQARRLLGDHADRRLPEAQWMALQAHLERCPECRLYGARQEMLENNLRRALHARWRPVSGPAEGMGRGVQAAFLDRQKRRRRAVYTGFGLLAVLALAVFGPGFFRRAYAPLAPVPTLPTATVDLSTPTLSPDQRFQGVVLFESGDKTLNMLTAGPAGADVEPLSSDSFQDTDPAWSPDGEWVAFLSNRAPGGKREVFLTNLVGGRLTQISSAPDVDWQGPLAWSPDGRWVALVGRRKILNEEPWVYLVPVDGTGSRVLPGTRGVLGGIRFTQDDLSPNPNLIFVSSLFGSSIVRYDPETGSSGVLTAEDNQVRGLKTAVDEDYDYSVLDGRYRLVYFAAGVNAPSSGGVTQIRSMSLYINDIARQTSFEQLDQVRQGSIQSVHFVPGDTRIVYLQGPDSSWCWRLQLRDTSAAASRSRSLLVRQLDGLCIVGGIDNSSFSANGRWLVVFAHPPDSSRVALYAVEIPPLNRPSVPLSFQHLADINLSRATGLIGSPHIRPKASSRAIQPKPVQQATQESTPSMAPGGMEGMLVLSAWPEMQAGAPQNPRITTPQHGVRIAEDLVLSNPTSRIVGGSPDGVAWRTLVPDDTMNACPVISPDRTKIVYLSDRRSGSREGWEVFVMYLTGGNAVQLTRRPLFEDIGDPTDRYDCPVWSPDGKYLATIQHTAFGTRLVVMTIDQGVIRSAIIDNPSSSSGLVWSHDGQQLFLLEPSRMVGPLRIIAFPWQQPTGPFQIQAIDGWEDAQAFSLSPDGKQMALVLAGPQGEQLRVYAFPGMKMLYKKDMPNADTSAQVRPGRIFWMAEGQIAFVYQYRPYERFKSAIIRYSPEDDVISYLTYSEDRLYDWILNGNWLVYSTESGVWGIDVTGRFDRPVSPIRLGDEIAYDLDWK